MKVFEDILGLDKVLLPQTTVKFKLNSGQVLGFCNALIPYLFVNPRSLFINVSTFRQSTSVFYALLLNYFQIARFLRNRVKVTLKLSFVSFPFAQNHFKDVSSDDAVQAVLKILRIWWLRVKWLQFPQVSLRIALQVMEITNENKLHDGRFSQNSLINYCFYCWNLFKSLPGETVRAKKQLIFVHGNSELTFCPTIITSILTNF